MEIRALQIGDLFTISQMLGKAKATGEKLTSPAELWLLLTEEAADDFLAWVASLAGKEVKEFQTMPAAVLLDIVEKLAEQEGFEDFLSGIRILSQPGGREKLIKLYSVLHRKYGIADGKTPFSRLSQTMRGVIRSRQKALEDAMAEAEEIIALARGEGE